MGNIVKLAERTLTLLQSFGTDYKIVVESAENDISDYDLEMLKNWNRLGNFFLSEEDLVKYISSFDDCGCSSLIPEGTYDVSLFKVFIKAYYYTSVGMTISQRAINSIMDNILVFQSPTNIVGIALDTAIIVYRCNNLDLLYFESEERFKTLHNKAFFKNTNVSWYSTSNEERLMLVYRNDVDYDKVKALFITETIDSRLYNLVKSVCHTYNKVGFTTLEDFVRRLDILVTHGNFSLRQKHIINDATDIETFINKLPVKCTEILLESSELSILHLYSTDIYKYLCSQYKRLEEILPYAEFWGELLSVIDTYRFTAVIAVDINKIYNNWCDCIKNMKMLQEEVRGYRKFIEDISGLAVDLLFDNSVEYHSSPRYLDYSQLSQLIYVEDDVANLIAKDLVFNKGSKLKVNVSYPFDISRAICSNADFLDYTIIAGFMQYLAVHIEFVNQRDKSVAESWFGLSELVDLKKYGYNVVRMDRDLFDKLIPYIKYAFAYKVSTSHYDVKPSEFIWENMSITLDSTDSVIHMVYRGK